MQAPRWRTAGTCLLLAAACWTQGRAARAAGLRAPSQVGLALAGGLQAGGQGRAMAHVDVGLPGHFALRTTAGAALTGTRVDARLLAGPLWSFDALSWVPRCGLLVGLSAPDARPEVQLGVEGLRYVGLQQGLFVGAWASWQMRRRFGGLVVVGFAWEP